MQNERKKFPLISQCIYANTAATGLLSEDLLEWRQEHDLDYLIGGSTMKMKSNKMHSETRTVIGGFFNCPVDNVALVPNFTIGLNLLLEGLDKKEKVLVLDGDYPSLTWPFESRGFETSVVEITSNLEERIYEAIKANNSTVLALSIVQWLDGMRIDLSFLKQLKAEFPELLIIADGTQYLGTTNFDFSNSALDIIGASGYKWLLAGYGNGLLLTKEHAQQRFKLLAKGYGSGRNTIEYEQQRTFCKHLEPGHLDSLSFGSLRFSLEYLQGLGMDIMEAKLDELSERAKVGFAELGLLTDKVVSRKQHSTIFNIVANDAVYNLLLKNNVVCSQRGDGIRLSFHFYNTLEEIDAIIKILKKKN